MVRAARPLPDLVPHGLRATVAAVGTGGTGRVQAARCSSTFLGRSGSTAREMLRPEGTVLIADERGEDEFTAPASELEQYHYAWSVVSCLPTPWAICGPEPPAR